MIAYFCSGAFFAVGASCLQGSTLFFAKAVDFFCPAFYEKMRRIVSFSETGAPVPTAVSFLRELGCMEGL